MSPEAQRIAIAKACGWKVENHESGTQLTDPDGYVVNQHYAEPWRVPDYLKDLNAMHEAEKILTHDQRDVYFSQLFDMANADENHGPGEDGLDIMLPSSFTIVHSSASQRAEAFLRTLNLWTND